MNFPERNNLLIYETMLPDKMSTDERERMGYAKKFEDNQTNTLTMVSNYYLYTGTPPHGYGSQAPKVAETVNRAYSYNLKKNEDDKNINIGGYNIERLQWEHEKDGEFPFFEVHGNFVTKELKEMCRTMLLDHYTVIDSVVERVINKMANTNSDVLTTGRQTFCPFTEQSTPAPAAYRRAFDFFKANGEEPGMSCLDWIRSTLRMFEKDKITYQTSKYETVPVRKYNKTTKQHAWSSIRKKRYVTLETSGIEETRKVMMDLTRRFASYIKHKERGKKDRRAICSAGVFLRMFLRVIEEFHLELARDLPGSTISIGGEEKKAKIAAHLTIKNLGAGVATTVAQGTEDATKWNECLAPSAFALMHCYLFDNRVRASVGVPFASELGELFSKIAVTGNFFMAVKQIQIGVGSQVIDDNYYSKLEWKDECRDQMNERTKEWYDKLRKHISPCGKYANASPGMLMGMLNAGSTTLGLLPQNHKMDKRTMMVKTLRSSDDSMTTYLSTSATSLKMCIHRNICNLALVGINMSPDKTFFFKEGMGEYTSWYMEDRFVAQFGVETSALRPQGKNPNDDFYAISKGTATAIQTLTINQLGASARIRLGVDGVRRLYRIERNPTKRNMIKDEVLSVCDGGKNLWNPLNCHIDDTVLRERNATTEQEKKYLYIIRHPENPFTEEIDEEMCFSKELGKMTLEKVENPRNIFCYVKRSNRTLNSSSRKDQEEMERAHGEAVKLIRMIDLPTNVDYPRTSTNIATNLKSILEMQRGGLDLNEEEEELYREAIRRLEHGDNNQEEFDPDLDEDEDL